MLLDTKSSFTAIGIMYFNRPVHIWETRGYFYSIYGTYFRCTTLKLSVRPNVNLLKVVKIRNYIISQHTKLQYHWNTHAELTRLLHKSQCNTFWNIALQKLIILQAILISFQLRSINLRVNIECEKLEHQLTIEQQWIGRLGTEMNHIPY